MSSTTLTEQPVPQTRTYPAHLVLLVGYELHTRKIAEEFARNFGDSIHRFVIDDSKQMTAEVIESQIESLDTMLDDLVHQDSTQIAVCTCITLSHDFIDALVKHLGERVTVAVIETDPSKFERDADLSGKDKVAFREWVKERQGGFEMFSRALLQRYRNRRDMCLSVEHRGSIIAQAEMISRKIGSKTGRK